MSKTGSKRLRTAAVLALGGLLFVAVIVFFLRDRTTGPGSRDAQVADEPGSGLLDFSASNEGFTEEALQADARDPEWLRMRKHLPNNYWLAGRGRQLTRKEILHRARMDELETKRRSETATPEELRELKGFTTKITRDRIALLEYLTNRAADFPDQNRYTEEDLEAARREILELRKRARE